MTRPLPPAKFLLSEADPARLPECAAEVTFVGRSNVGKSSLLNAVVGKPLARVSNTPGRTKTINVFEAGHGRWLVDLPGYGFAAGKPEEREGWQQMIEGYLTKRPTLRMVFLLIDSKVGPTKLDASMIEWLRATRLPWLPVATKGDQVGASRAKQRQGELAGMLGVSPDQLLWVSAEKGYGIGRLKAEVAALLEG